MQKQSRRKVLTYQRGKWNFSITVITQALIDNSNIGIEVSISWFDLLSTRLRRLCIMLDTILLSAVWLLDNASQSKHMLLTSSDPKCLIKFTFMLSTREFPSMEDGRVDFPFPYQPYNIQLQFMQALYSALDQGKVGIFESPTGTVCEISAETILLCWFYVF